MILTLQRLQLIANTVTKQWSVKKGLCRQLTVSAQEAVEIILPRKLSASLQESNQMILIKDHEECLNDQDNVMKFPGIWLRDNCQCDQCFHKDSLSRKPSRWNNFDCDVKVKHIEVDENTKQIHIDWSDKHQSTFTMDWLTEHSFSKAHQDKYIKSWYRPQPKTWNKEEFTKILKKFQYNDIMKDDEVLKEWLETLATRGVSILKNAPLEIGVTKSICNRVGFIRKTTYGEDFSVKSRPGAKNYAFLCEPLPLHTDLPYYEYKPSVTILHTLEQSQSTGGWNCLTDGYYVADQLKEKYPEHFRILKETLVDWCDIGEDDDRQFHNIWRAPVINLDKDGHYTRINHSIPQRDSHFSIDVDKVVPWYRANALFVRMAHEQSVHFKTKPGDVLTFNNLRLLHGRTGYNDNENNVRHIAGGFVDWDIIYSKIRVLKKNLN